MKSSLNSILAVSASINDTWEDFLNSPWKQSMNKAIVNDDLLDLANKAN